MFTGIIESEGTILELTKKGNDIALTISYDQKICKISNVGVGMKSNVGVAKIMFETLAKNQINIHVISTSEIKISVLISSDYYELAMRSLHSAFGLDV